MVDSVTDFETIDRTISGCAWLVDVAEECSSRGSEEAAIVARWLENLGSRMYVERLALLQKIH